MLPVAGLGAAWGVCAKQRHVQPRLTKARGMSADLNRKAMNKVSSRPAHINTGSSRVRWVVTVLRWENPCTEITLTIPTDCLGESFGKQLIGPSRFSVVTKVSSPSAVCWTLRQLVKLHSVV